MASTILGLLCLLIWIPTFYGLVGSWRSTRGEHRRIWYDSLWAIGSLAIAITPTFNWITFILNFIAFLIIGFSVVTQLALYYEFENDQAAYEGWKKIMKDEWTSFKERTKKKIERIMPL